MANVKLQYPYSDLYKYEAQLVRIDMEDERENDVSKGKGFVVARPQSIKKDIKNINGIFSTRFGRTLQDANPYGNRYKCSCGHTETRLNNGILCPLCKTPVKFVDDDFTYFGWICLKDPYYIIHPNLYKAISSLVGPKKLPRMLLPLDEKDKDGNSIDPSLIKRPPDEPFMGIGMIEFKERFREIIDFYMNKASDKTQKFMIYEDIVRDIDKVFIQSIPVYTTHLRPYKLEGDTLSYEGTNAIYNIILRLSHNINNDTLKINRKLKPKNQLLYDIQMKYMELYGMVEQILGSKKGSIRSLFGGRYNLTGRNVIALDPSLRIDQIRLPYRMLCELLQQLIVNILHKSYNMTYDAAYIYWYKASMKDMDETLVNIINSIINSYDEGLPIIINRNPTINYGGILQMFCIGINNDYTMSVPYGVLLPMAADFDGDTLNIMYIINKDFFEMANMVFNPRNSMYISKNDGMTNSSVLPMKDIIININTIINLSRDSYSGKQLEMINKVKGE